MLCGYLNFSKKLILLWFQRIVNFASLKKIKIKEWLVMVIFKTLMNMHFYERSNCYVASYLIFKALLDV
jgi:hypothetical protein